MNTIDIHSIHKAILNDYQSSSVTEQQQEKKPWEELYKQLGKSISSDVISDLKSYCEMKDEKLAYEYYLIAAIPILDEFSESKKKIQKISFFKKNNTNQGKEYMQLIERYIDCVNKYFPEKYEYHWKTHPTVQNVIKKQKKNSSSTVCNYCQEPQENFVISDNNIICGCCGNVHDITNDNLISYKDIERVNIGSKYSYDRKVHFRECMKRYQGKQNCSIPQTLFDDITNQLKKYQLIPEEYETGREKEIFQDIHRQHILMILKDLGYSKYYEDITYIYHKITKKKIPDIGEYENILLNDFDKLLEIYDSQYKDIDRKNFINNQYVLYQLLRRHNYPVEKQNFTFLKTNDRKSYHDKVCGELFTKLNWNFRPLF